MCNNEFINRLVNSDKIIEAGVSPKEPDRPNEPTKYEVFKELAKEKLTTVTNLAEIAGSGIAHKKDAEAKKTYAECQKTIEEAANIAAEKEASLLANIEIENKIIDDIFRPGQNPLAQKMKLANFCRKDPDILEAFEHVEELLKILSYKNGLVVHFLNNQSVLGTEDSSKYLPKAKPES